MRTVRFDVQKYFTMGRFVEVKGGLWIKWINFALYNNKKMFSIIDAAVRNVCTPLTICFTLKD